VNLVSQSIVSLSLRSSQRLSSPVLPKQFLHPQTPKTSTSQANPIFPCTGWKAGKVLVNSFSYYCLINLSLHRPKLHPKYSPKDVTVIVPSIGNFDDEFEQCIKSILVNAPRRIIVSTVGYDKLRRAQKVCERLEEHMDFKVSITFPKFEAAPHHLGAKARYLFRS
jgi:hypothetical protein